MAVWFEALPVIEKFFLFIALPATLILIIQTLLLFTGGQECEPGDVDLDSDISGMEADGTDMDFDGDAEDLADILASDRDGSSGGRTDSSGLRFVTLRGIIAFFTVAGWTGILCMELGLPASAACFIAFVFGFGAMVGIAYLVQALLGLQSSGNIDYRLALGRFGDVYLTIPPNGSGIGKVSMTLGGAFSEYDAITESGTAIKTGAMVRVTDVVRESVLVVEAVSDERAAAYARDAGEVSRNN